MVKIIKVTRDRAGLHIFLDRARVKDADYKVKRSDPPAVGKVHETTTGEKIKITSVRNPKNPDGTWSVKGTTDAGHMPTARGTQRGIPAKTAEDLRALHGSIRSHKDDCSCASCKGKTRDERKDGTDPGYTKRLIKELMAQGKTKKEIMAILAKEVENYFPKDAAIKAPPAKVSKTKSSEQAREIEAKLKNAKDVDIPRLKKTYNSLLSELNSGTFSKNERYNRELELNKLRKQIRAAEEGTSDCSCQH